MEVFEICNNGSHEVECGEVEKEVSDQLLVKGLRVSLGLLDVAKLDTDDPFQVWSLCTRFYYVLYHSLNYNCKIVIGFFLPKSKQKQLVSGQT